MKDFTYHSREIDLYPVGSGEPLIMIKFVLSKYCLTTMKGTDWVRGQRISHYVPTEVHETSDGPVTVGIKTNK